MAKKESCFIKNWILICIFRNIVKRKGWCCDAVRLKYRGSRNVRNHKNVVIGCRLGRVKGVWLDFMYEWEINFRRG